VLRTCPIPFFSSFGPAVLVLSLIIRGLAEPWGFERYNNFLRAGWKMNLLRRDPLRIKNGEIGKNLLMRKNSAKKVLPFSGFFLLNRRRKSPELRKLMESKMIF